ncbi:Hypothetical protein MSYG_4068 [Malassezia sympodialis ATCC 42132]|uniref:Uncharacterized protein n=1 Tax=Malassezia sympodialis (strain ATCC 42132) TaxID=1230383 RepID=A0A1M8ABA2_MALS4|nr:Hypothetical protein MSYG_4068 [Malassezia sympodialis ATCC 42132]
MASVLSVLRPRKASTLSTCARRGAGRRGAVHRRHHVRAACGVSMHRRTAHEAVGCGGGAKIGARRGCPRAG